MLFGTFWEEVLKFEIWLVSSCSHCIVIMFCLHGTIIYIYLYIYIQILIASMGLVFFYMVHLNGFDVGKYTIVSWI